MYNSSGGARIFQGGEGGDPRGSGERVQILTSATGRLFKILFKYYFNFVGFSNLPLDFDVLLTVYLSIILVINQLNVRNLVL